MKISFDIHGVIDIAPVFFASLTKRLKKAGYEIYICTGSSVESIEPDIKNWNITYDRILSVVDFHRSIGTPMWENEKGQPELNPETWNRSKGILCSMYNIDVHFDDSDVYGDYFRTGYIQVKGIGDLIRGLNPIIEPLISNKEVKNEQ